MTFIDTPRVVSAVILLACIDVLPDTVLPIVTVPTNPAVFNVLKAAALIIFPRCPRILLVVVTSPPT
jgi:hypothetical protein